MLFECDPPCNVAQITPAAARIGQCHSRIVVAGYFQHECPAKSDFYQVAQERIPVDSPVARRPVIVIRCVVVMCMDHPQMSGEFKHQVVHVASQKGVTGIKTNTHASGVDSVEDPQDVARVPKKEMRQFVFQHTHDAALLAAPGDLIQGIDNVSHPRQLLGRRDRGWIFRPGMHHKIVYAQKRRRFRRFENFCDGRDPLRFIGRGDVDLGREGRMK